jgi:hypothetical protein
MNNKPVAWINSAYLDGLTNYDMVVSAVKVSKKDIPLYTHPADLTDEEIEELSEEHLDMDWQTGVIDFARAILRKASEK